MSTIRLPLESIRLDGGTQARVGLNPETIDEYAEAYKRRSPMPVVIVFHDGKEYWLADGFHRWHGAKRAGRAQIGAEVRSGTQRDAILYSVGANGAHGLKRSNADKRRAVETLLGDKEWSTKSDRWISEKCSVSHQLVGEMRAQLVAATSSEPNPAKSGERSKGKDGRWRKPPKAKQPPPAPSNVIPISSANSDEPPSRSYANTANQIMVLVNEIDDAEVLNEIINCINIRIETLEKKYG